jgi:hypothetical protein
MKFHKWDRSWKRWQIWRAECTSNILTFLGAFTKLRKTTMYSHCMFMYMTTLTEYKSSKSRWRPMGCTETSARIYHYSLCNSPEERSFHLFHGGSLKLRIHVRLLIGFTVYASYILQPRYHLVNTTIWPVGKSRPSKSCLQIFTCVMLYTGWPRSHRTPTNTLP